MASSMLEGNYFDGLKPLVKVYSLLGAFPGKYKVTLAMILYFSCNTMIWLAMVDVRLTSLEKSIFPF